MLMLNRYIKVTVGVGYYTLSVIHLADYKLHLSAFDNSSIMLTATTGYGYMTYRRRRLGAHCFGGTRTNGCHRFGAGRFDVTLTFVPAAHCSVTATWTLANCLLLVSLYSN